MAQYARRRIALMVPTLIVVLITVFMMVRLIPGDIVDLLITEEGYADDREALEELLGLDKSIPEQFVFWVGDLVQGDLGESLYTGRAATTELKQIVPVTLELAVLTLIFSTLIGVPIGVISAVRQGSVSDFSLRSFAVAGLSIPSFWFATLLLVLGAIWFDWAPPLVYRKLWEDPLTNLYHFSIPAFIVSLQAGATIMRLTRSMMLEVLRQDFVRTAQAKGLAYRTVVVRHVLRNAMITIVTIIGLQTATILSGTVIMEVIFGLPGMGRFVLSSIIERDYPMLQMITLFLAIAVLFVNLVVDLSYGLLDPRVRLS